MTEPRGNGNTIRQELWRIEDRLVGDIAAVAKSLEEFEKSHRDEHHAIATAHELRRTNTDARFLAILRTQEGVTLADARRQGALGVFKVVLDTLSHNWPVLVALLGGLLALTNNIHITFL